MQHVGKRRKQELAVGGEGREEVRRAVESSSAGLGGHDLSPRHEEAHLEALRRAELELRAFGTADSQMRLKDKEQVDLRWRRRALSGVAE